MIKVYLRFCSWTYFLLHFFNHLHTIILFVVSIPNLEVNLIFLEPPVFWSFQHFPQIQIGIFESFYLDCDSLFNGTLLSKLNSKFFSEFLIWRIFYQSFFGILKHIIDWFLESLDLLDLLFDILVIDIFVNLLDFFEHGNRGIQLRSLIRILIEAVLAKKCGQLFRFMERDE